MFLVQGIALAVWDIGGNTITLKTWDGISTSPLNAMHAGYGIGGILAVQISKPFIKFDKMTPLPESGANGSGGEPQASAADISIGTPYIITATIGVAVCVLCFLAAQALEAKNRSRYRKLLGDTEAMLKKEEQLNRDG